MNKQKSINEVLTKIGDSFAGSINDKKTRELVVETVTQNLLPILGKFEVICDESNNPVSVIVANKLVGKIVEKDSLSYKCFIYDFEFKPTVIQ